MSGNYTLNRRVNINALVYYLWCLINETKLFLVVVFTDICTYMSKERRLHFQVNLKTVEAVLATTLVSDQL